mmetsp:Transcript_6337/g.9896  ORF Transcript_6337/g.9896 Transcript_6337/m.9896 type:complete len:227 (-) Transcript_6337:329-1009(-)
MRRSVTEEASSTVGWKGSGGAWAELRPQRKPSFPFREEHSRDAIEGERHRAVRAVAPILFLVPREHKSLDRDRLALSPCKGHRGKHEWSDDHDEMMEEGNSQVGGHNHTEAADPKKIHEADMHVRDAEMGDCLVPCHEQTLPCHDEYSLLHFVQDAKHYLPLLQNEGGQSVPAVVLSLYPLPVSGPSLLQPWKIWVEREFPYHHWQDALPLSHDCVGSLEVEPGTR